MSKNSLFCPKKESSISQKVLIEIFFNVISHHMYMVWLDLHAKSAPDTGTPSVEAHKCAVCTKPGQIVSDNHPLFLTVGYIIAF